eukprot:COSAG04_NODE_3328_length_2926_cov_21.296198_2_plen_122_part_00
MRTKPPKVKLPGLLPPLPALWATVIVGVWASQAARNLAPVSQPSKVEQHSDHSWPSPLPAQPFSVAPHSAVSSREPRKCGPPHESPHGHGVHSGSPELPGRDPQFVGPKPGWHSQLLEAGL